jgi:hypothetical protein
MPYSKPPRPRLIAASQKPIAVLLNLTLRPTAGLLKQPDQWKN